MPKMGKSLRIRLCLEVFSKRRNGRLAEALHTMPMEAGVLTMTELISAMKKDALEQDKIVAIVADLLEQTVNRNDKMQVWS